VSSAFANSIVVDLDVSTVATSGTAKQIRR
jgi:hypothetical protein